MPTILGSLSEDERQALLRSAQNIRDAALPRLANTTPPVAAAQFVGQLHAGIAQVFDGAQRAGVALACRPGCSHCCSARVEAFPPEVQAIARAVKALALPDFEATLGRMRAHTARTAPGTQEAGANSWQDNAPCPLLVNQLCSVYAVRPSACRRAHSLAVEPCQQGAPQIPQSLQVLAGVSAWTTGLLAAYADAGFEAPAQEMVAAVLAELDSPK